MDPSLEILLADASVLIDYRDSDLTILKLVSQHTGPVRVLAQQRHPRHDRNAVPSVRSPFENLRVSG
jgi:hypothetical protein